jgi:ribosomal protein L24E
MKSISILIFCALVLNISVLEAKTNEKTKANKTATQKNQKIEIGRLAQVKGDVWLDGVKAKSGTFISKNSEIVTGQKGSTMVLIGEGMVAAVGYNSNIVIENLDNPLTKIKKSNFVIKNEMADINLKSGSVRMLVRKDNNTVRLATVRSGNAFGIVKDGEAHFTCDAACAKTAINKAVPPTKVTK